MAIDGVNNVPVQPTTTKPAGTSSAGAAPAAPATGGPAAGAGAVQDNSSLAANRSASGGSDLVMYVSKEVPKEIKVVLPPAPEVQAFTAHELTPVTTPTTIDRGQSSTSTYNYQDLTTQQPTHTTTTLAATGGTQTNNQNGNQVNNVNNNQQTNNYQPVQQTPPTELKPEIQPHDYSRPPMQISVNPPNAYAPMVPQEKVIEVGGTGMGADKTFKMYPSELAAMYSLLKKNGTMSLEDMRRDLLTYYGIDTEIKDGTLVNKENGHALISDTNGNGSLDMGDLNFDQGLADAGIDPSKLKEPGSNASSAMSGLAYWANYWADQVAKAFADDGGPKASEAHDHDLPSVPSSQPVIPVKGGDQTFNQFPSELAATYALIKKNDGPMDMNELQQQLKDRFGIDTELRDGTLVNTDTGHELLADINGSGQVDLTDVDFEGALRNAGIDPSAIEPSHNANAADQLKNAGIRSIIGSGEDFEKLIDANGQDDKKYWQFPSELASMYDVLKANDGPMSLSELSQKLKDEFGIDTAIEQRDGKDTLVASTGHELIADTDGSGSVDLKDLDFEDTLRRAGIDPDLIQPDHNKALA